eukprot:TRINITY_DN81187_c0_g1_i1.p1 TRINITY_DN81187_c0_g1~~TRINITY_DN81187_c0_g1_i1.p1  ORF type:complete len:263 (-),score=34.20 TRINITY_DN81187_c0_g1_i1:93-845(-)
MREIMQSQRGVQVLFCKEMLLQVLYYLPDESVLSLAVTSGTMQREVSSQSCVARPGGPWRHPRGLWQPAGLWQHLGLKALASCLRNMPTVILCCEHSLRDAEEVSAFLDAAKGLAAETEDGTVFFNSCTFTAPDVSRLFSGADQEPDNAWCCAQPSADIALGDVTLKCSVEALCFEVGMPALTLHACCEDIDLKFDVRCCSPELPSLRLVADEMGSRSDHELDSTSPLRRAVCANKPLAMLLGVVSHSVS